MKLSKNHSLIRWAYLPERFGATERGPAEIPANTTLCAILWRALVGVPLFCLIAIPIVCILFVCVLPVAWMEKEFPETRFAKWCERRWKQGVIYAAFTDWKNKTCTRVEIIDAPLRTSTETTAGAPPASASDPK